MKKGLGTQRLVALALAAALLFNAPLAQLWQGHPVALFVAWGGVIALLAWLMERRADDDGDRRP